MKKRRSGGNRRKRKKYKEDKLEIREIKKEDLKAVIKIIKETMGEKDAREAKWSFRWYFSSLKPIKFLRSWKYWVAVQNGQVVGISGFYELKYSFWLGWFAVKPEFQENGIGNLLYQKFEKTGKERGFKEIFVETSREPQFAKAREFYQRKGFRATEVPDYPWQYLNILFFKKELS